MTKKQTPDLSVLVPAQPDLPIVQIHSPYCGRTAYTGAVRHPKEFLLPSRTKQEFKAEADINNIVKRFLATGVIDQTREAYAKYVDLSDLPESYHEALNLVQRVGAVFEAMPAESRASFNNDPDAFLRAASEDPTLVFGPSATTPAKPPEGPTQPSPEPVTATVETPSQS